MIDINMNYDLKKENTISETFGTVVSMTILLKDKGFSDDEVMTVLSIMIGCDLKPMEELIVNMKGMLSLCGSHDNFIKLLVPISNQARSEIEEGGKNG